MAKIVALIVCITAVVGQVIALRKCNQYDARNDLIGMKWCLMTIIGLCCVGSIAAVMSVIL